MSQSVFAGLALLLALSGDAGDASAASAPAVAVHVNIWNGTGSVTFVDPETFTVGRTAEFEQVPRPLRFDAAGRSLLVVTWSQSKKKPVNLWSVDTESAASTPLAELGRGLPWFLPDPGFTRLYTVAGTKKSKPKTISVFDLVARKPSGPLASVERMTLLQVSPDGALLYAFCEGHTHKKPRGPPGNLHVLDAMTGAELGRIEAGQGASSVAFDTTRGLAYVMGVADLDGKGALTVLRGGSVVARLDVRGRPMGLRLAPDGGSYLLTSSAVIALDAEGLAAGRVWALDFGPSDLIFDPDHDLMFAGAGAGSKIAMMTISGGEVVVQHPTGDPGRKFGKGIGAALYFVFAIAAAAGGAYVPTPFLTVQNSTSMLLNPDGSILYVLNPYTNDVSIFDVRRRDVVDIVHMGGGSQRFVQLPGDPTFWVQSRENLAHFDTSANRIDRTIDLQKGLSYTSVSYETARERAWVTMKTKALVFDLRTGGLVGQLDLPASPVGIWIDDSRKLEPDSPHP